MGKSDDDGQRQRVLVIDVLRDLLQETRAARRIAAILDAQQRVFSRLPLAGQRALFDSLRCPAREAVVVVVPLPARAHRKTVVGPIANVAGYALPLDASSC